MLISAKTLLTASALFSFLALASCTQPNIDGKYVGKDTSKNPSTSIEMDLGRVGDGYINGTFTAAGGPVTKAIVIGSLGYFKNKIKLVVNEGPCAGNYAGTFSRSEGMISGTIEESGKCPDFMRSFEIQRQ